MREAVRRDTSSPTSPPHLHYGINVCSQSMISPLFAPLGAARFFSALKGESARTLAYNALAALEKHLGAFGPRSAVESAFPF